jgi:hypothetical protein
MDIQDGHTAFALIVGIVTCVYIAFFLKKIPYPSGEFGTPINAIIAVPLAIITAFAVNLLAMVAGTIGYLVAAVVLFPATRKLIKGAIADSAEGIIT